MSANYRPGRPEARAGIGLRAPHVGELLATRPAVPWLEVHPENYMMGGAALASLEAARRDYPVSFHGVGLSLGSAGEIDRRHLERLKTLVDRIEPCLVSEHLSWSTSGGGYLNHLLPLPYTDETLAVVASHIHEVQETFGHRILIENPSSYLRFRHSTIPEPEFLAELARQTGCRLLCDVNNIHVTAWNLCLDAIAYLDALPTGTVAEIHLAGHARNDADGPTILIDDHGSRVSPPVWTLYRAALQRFGPVPTLVEWDTDIPELPVLLAEARTADACSRRPGLEVVMPALRDLQRFFKDGLLADDEETVLAHIPGDELDPRARLAIYRHHVLTTLTTTLESAFPVVCQLVDKRFFAYAADAFIRQHPPAGPCLVEYGALFPEFLEGFPPCQGYPYLPDIARLEWAVHQAAQVAEVRPLDRARLDAISLDDLPGLRFSMDPTLSYVSSRWPVDKIWGSHQEGAEPAEFLDLSAGGTCLEVRGVGDGVSVRVLDPAAYALRHALAVGVMLEEAAGEALAIDPSFDLIGAIQKLLQDQIFIDFKLST